MKNCPTSSSYSMGSKQAGWGATTAHSAFESAPGVISLTVTKTATFTATFSSTVSVEVSAFVAKASASLGVAYSAAVGRNQAWTYSKSYKGSTAQRVVVSKRGDAIVFTTYYDGPDCKSHTYKNQVGHVPRSSNGANDYCLHLDGYPASTWETTSGGCVDQS